MRKEVAVSKPDIQNWNNEAKYEFNENIIKNKLCRRCQLAIEPFLEIFFQNRRAPVAKRSQSAVCSRDEFAAPEQQQMSNNTEFKRSTMLLKKQREKDSLKQEELSYSQQEYNSYVEQTRLLSEKQELECMLTNAKQQLLYLEQKNNDISEQNRLFLDRINEFKLKEAEELEEIQGRIEENELLLEKNSMLKESVKFQEQYYTANESLKEEISSEQSIISEEEKELEDYESKYIIQEQSFLEKKDELQALEEDYYKLKISSGQYIEKIAHLEKVLNSQLDERHYTLERLKSCTDYIHQRQEDSDFEVGSFEHEKDDAEYELQQSDIEWLETYKEELRYIPNIEIFAVSETEKVLYEYEKVKHYCYNFDVLMQCNIPKNIAYLASKNNELCEQTCGNYIMLRRLQKPFVGSILYAQEYEEEVKLVYLGFNMYQKYGLIYLQRGEDIYYLKSNH